MEEVVALLASVVATTAVAAVVHRAVVVATELVNTAASHFINVTILDLLIWSSLGF